MEPPFCKSPSIPLSQRGKFSAALILQGKLAPLYERGVRGYFADSMLSQQCTTKKEISTHEEVNQEGLKMGAGGNGEEQFRRGSP
jgi:hypothetical protein